MDRKLGGEKKTSQQDFEASCRASRIPEITRQMVTSDSRWPGLVLPLKRLTNDNFMECAYLTDPVAPGGPIRIYVGYQFSITKSDKALQYDSIDAFLAAGWEVD